MPSLQERARQAAVAGFTNTQLAKAAGVSLGAVSHWFSGGTVKLRAQSAIGLAALTGWNAKWWTDGIGPRESVDRVAQSVSLPSGTVVQTAALQLHLWGELVTMEKLPDVFDTLLPDDAMGPEFPEGMRVEFESTDTAKFGELVILRTRDGKLYCRRLQQIPGGWIGQRSREGFMTVEPERDGAIVVAAMTAFETRVKR